MKKTSDGQAGKPAGKGSTEPIDQGRKTARGSARINCVEPDFEKCGNGLIPAVAQDADTGEILMLAYMNRESFQKTLETGEVHYYSRSRQELWHKGGGSSGRVQRVAAMYLDCDCDAVVVKIHQVGGVSCHTGRRGCFHYRLDEDTKSFRLVD